MNKRFIVLVDFSEHSQFLVSYALHWASEVNAHLLFVHHSTEPVPGLGETEIRTAIKTSRDEQELERLRDFVENISGPALAAEYHIDHYNISSAIIKLQKNGTADYLFSGIRQKSQFEALLMGNTATLLVEDLNNIIIAIPEHQPDFNLKHFCIAIKNGIPLNEPAFEQLLNIRKKETEDISFFTVLKDGTPETEAQEYLEYLKRRYEQTANVTVQLIHNNDTATTIKNHVLTNNGVLIVQKGTRNFADIFRKYFTSHIVKYANIPVIILP